VAPRSLQWQVCDGEAAGIAATGGVPAVRRTYIQLGPRRMRTPLQKRIDSFCRGVYPSSQEPRRCAHPDRPGTHRGLNPVARAHGCHWGVADDQSCSPRVCIRQTFDAGRCAAPWRSESEGLVANPGQSYPASPRESVIYVAFLRPVWGSRCRFLLLHQSMPFLNSGGHWISVRSCADRGESRRA